MLVILSDGRPNIALDGAPGRARAEADALGACEAVRIAGVEAIYLDTSARPAPGADRFARAMGAAFAPLPYADARAVAALVDARRPR